jgi:hypothetical protein
VVIVTFGVSNPPSRQIGTSPLCVFCIPPFCGGIKGFEPSCPARSGTSPLCQRGDSGGFDSHTPRLHQLIRNLSGMIGLKPTRVFVFSVHEINLVAIFDSSHQLSPKRPLHQAIEQLLQLPPTLPLLRPQRLDLLDQGGKFLLPEQWRLVHRKFFEQRRTNV